MIKVILFPPLAISKKVIEVPMEGKDYISVQQLVESVNSMTGEFSGFIDLGNDDKFDQKLMILVNDKFVADHDLVYQGDTVRILPNMAGG